MITFFLEVKPDEGPSLHMTEIPASFAGQHLVSTPKPIVSAVPFSSGNFHLTNEYYVAFIGCCGEIFKS